MKESSPFVSIITVNYNGKHLLAECFASLLSLDYPRDKMEIIMVDNCSEDDSVMYTNKYYPQVKIIESRDNNYCKANNLGIAQSKGEYVALLNNDTRVDKNWLTELIKVMEDDAKIGVAGSKILLMDGRVQSAGHVEFPGYYWGDRGLFEKDGQQYNITQEAPSVSNCSALYRRRALDKAGLFDEDFIMYMEDVDMGLRIKQKGWRIIYAPNSIVYHKMHGSGQSAQEQRFYVERNRLLFMAKHLPEKLSEELYGHSGMMGLSHSEFQSLLTLAFNKLIKHHGAKKAVDIFSGLKGTIKKIDDYKQHCKEIEKEGVILDIRHQLESKTAENRLLKEDIEAKDRSAKELLSKIGTLEERVSSLSVVITNKDEEIYARNNELLGKDAQIGSLTADKAASNEQINKLKDEAVVRNEEMSVMNTEILRKDSEISNIYNSETYRFLIKPFIWPLLSFVKAMIKPVHMIFRKDKPATNKSDIYIAQLFAKNSNAKHRQNNEYAVKIFNNKAKEETIRLVIDIWPHKDQSHPARHYCYFAIEFPVRAKNAVMLQVVYDWEKNAEIHIGDKKEEIKDFWRGTLVSSDLYVVNACLYENTTGKIIDKLEIMQRLIK